jgi:hypothetical protein
VGKAYDWDNMFIRHIEFCIHVTMIPKTIILSLMIFFRTAVTTTNTRNTTASTSQIFAKGTK